MGTKVLGGVRKKVRQKVQRGENGIKKTNMINIMRRGRTILDLGFSQNLHQDLSATQEEARAEEGRMKERDTRRKEEILAMETVQIK